MSGTDGLLRFLDNGGRRAYIGRRTRPGLFPVPDRRKSNAGRRTVKDRRKVLNEKRTKGPERRRYFKD